MPTTPRGIWTPSDSDDWDLTVDWAANAASIDTAITNAVAEAQPVDLGWTPITLLNGWTADLSRTPRIRRVGNVISMQGQVTGGTSTTIAGIGTSLGPSLFTLAFPNLSSKTLTISSGGTISISSVGTPVSLNYSWLMG